MKSVGELDHWVETLKRKDEHIHSLEVTLEAQRQLVRALTESEKAWRDLAEKRAKAIESLQKQLAAAELGWA